MVLHVLATMSVCERSAPKETGNEIWRNIETRPVCKSFEVVKAEKLSIFNGENGVDVFNLIVFYNVKNMKCKSYMPKLFNDPTEAEIKEIMNDIKNKKPPRVVCYGTANKTKQVDHMAYGQEVDEGKLETCRLMWRGTHANALRNPNLNLRISAAGMNYIVIFDMY